MIEFLQYPFFRHALYGVAIISIAAAIIGTYIITRRLVAISGGVTHACFGGLGLGYFLGVSPVAMAAVFAVASSVLFVFLTPGYVPELNSFLFGNILNISDGDLWAFGIYLAVLLVFFCSSYQKIIACAFDRDFAQVNGLKVRLINYTMTVMVAVCIVLTIRLVGIMLLMSMLTLPQMVAETFFHRFKTMAVASVVVSVTCCVAGLFLAAAIDVPCSAVIVILLAGVFIAGRTVQALLPQRA